MDQDGHYHHACLPHIFTMYDTWVVIAMSTSTFAWRPALTHIQVAIARYWPDCQPYLFISFGVQVKIRVYSI